MCQFIVFVYIEAWYTSPLSAEAPYNYLKLVKKFEEYKVIDSELSSIAIKKIKNHRWYLVPECAALSFFDENIPTQTKKKMVEALSKENIFEKKIEKKFPPEKVNCLISENIDFFINSDLKHFFERFKLKTDFLKLDPSHWHENDEYIKNKIIVSKLRVTNDVAERAVKIASEYVNKSTTSEEQRQYIMQIVAHYKRQNPDTSKGSIIKNFKKDDSHSDK